MGNIDESPNHNKEVLHIAMRVDYPQILQLKSPLYTVKSSPVKIIIVPE